MDAINQPPPVLEVSGLCKNFGQKRVLDQVGFSVGKGEILGILGPNGAGKSTLIGILSGLLEPDAGTVEIFGRGFRTHRTAILGRMNLASPYAALPRQLTVRQNLLIYGGLYGVRQPARRVSELLDKFGIADKADIRLSKLSSGQTARVGLCKALLNAPDLLLLDEPTVYMDQEIAARTRALILQERAARKMTILLTSHNLDEIEHLCDRILLLNHGRVAASGTKLEVTRAMLGGQRERPALSEVFSMMTRNGA
jgi:ABC-2 type transport system ATP-binding protein